ncbi:hypothetical protein IWZ03DRAFT_23713 [Phyllosticta citriasiana]|uniref:Uncharacterized protein n=1 Tax=Phyllosticta citriasiana TaxID=595635 RepID=A0ABR1KZY1_9PEZI
MPIDWKTPESYRRLLAAMCAAQDGTIDFKKVAYYYGKGATYDSIEGRFRHAKKEAKKLQSEAEKEGRKMPVTRPKSANSTPRKPKATPSIENGVKTGRVSKSPSKKRSTAGNLSPVVKLEADSGSSAADTPSWATWIAWTWTLAFHPTSFRMTSTRFEDLRKIAVDMCLWSGFTFRAEF